jgi:hypothetical protein
VLPVVWRSTLGLFLAELLTLKANFQIVCVFKNVKDVSGGVCH